MAENRRTAPASSWLVPSTDLSLPDISSIPGHLYPGVDGAGATRLAIALLRADLASPYSWFPGSFGRTSTQNPPAFLQEVVWQWIGSASARTIRECIGFDIVLHPSYWTRPHGSADAWLSMWPNARLNNWFEHTVSPARVWRVGKAMERLASADPRLANFVYYSLVDSLRRIGPVYDWSTAAKEFSRRFGAAAKMSGGALREIGLTHLADGDPRAAVPTWLRQRQRITDAEAMAIAHRARYVWFRKTTEAAFTLRAVAAAVQRARLSQYPKAELRNLAGLVESEPIAVVAMTEMDPIEGMGLEYATDLRDTGAKNCGPASGLIVPPISLRMECGKPATLRRAHDVFAQVCSTLSATARLVHYLHRWDQGLGRGKKQAERARVQVRV